MSGELAKNVYEDLEILRQAAYVADTEAALERVVDHLLRASLGTSDQSRKAVIQGATKFQNVYYPIKDPEEGK